MNKWSFITLLLRLPRTKLWKYMSQVLNKIDGQLSGILHLWFQRFGFLWMFTVLLCTEAKQEIFLLINIFVRLDIQQLWAYSQQLSSWNYRCFLCISRIQLQSTKTWMCGLFTLLFNEVSWDPCAGNDLLSIPLQKISILIMVWKETLKQEHSPGCLNTT